MGGASLVCFGLEPQCRQSIEDVLVVGEGARNPSEQCQGTFKQGSKPTDAHLEPCDELTTHPGVNLPSPSVYPHQDPEGDKAVKKMRRDKCQMLKH